MFTVSVLAAARRRAVALPHHEPSSWWGEAMRWKTQTIIIRPAALGGSPDKLVADLGYGKRRWIGATSLLLAGGGSLWIGLVGDCVVIEAPHDCSLLPLRQLSY